MINAKEARQLARIIDYDADWLLEDLEKYIKKEAKLKRRIIKYALNSFEKRMTHDDLIFVEKELNENGYNVDIEYLASGIIMIDIRW